MVTVGRGRAFPLGPSVVGSSQTANGSVALNVNIAVFANVDNIAICVFPPRKPWETVTRDMVDEIEFASRTGGVWHVELQGIPEHSAYALRVHNTGVSNRLLCDPYAKWIESPGSEMWMKVEGEDYQCRDGSNKVNNVKTFLRSFPSLRERGIEYPFQTALIMAPAGSVQFDWREDKSPCVPYEHMVIYETHVRALTPDGTFRSAIAKIPYLKWLGVTSVELMPIFEFSEVEVDAMDGVYALLRDGSKIAGERRGNMWGYSPMSWFSPMNRYASSASSGAEELKQFVKALHEEGMECILDVVYNHTANASCPFHFLHVQSSYYIGKKRRGGFKHSNISGCGNTLSPNSPVMLELIMESLKWFVTEYHVDGFRIDAAGIFCRDPNGIPIQDPSIIDFMTSDPVLQNTKFIVEGWDAGDQIGSPNMLLGSKQGFPHGDRICEWNAEWRDAVRRFVRGDKNSDYAFYRALSGAPHLFGDGKQLKPSRQRPLGSGHSINFVACHDGFCMYDVTSYSKRVNSDGYDEISFDCGKNGPTDDDTVRKLRVRQLRNFFFVLAISRGVPMLTQGDEFGYSKGGNNNTWNDPQTYVARTPDVRNAELTEHAVAKFVRSMFKLRREYPQVCGQDFYEGTKWWDEMGHEQYRSDARHAPIKKDRCSSSRSSKMSNPPTASAKTMPSSKANSSNINRTTRSYVAFTTKSYEGKVVFAAFNNSQENIVACLPPDYMSFIPVVDTGAAEDHFSDNREAVTTKTVTITRQSAVLYVCTEKRSG